MKTLLILLLLLPVYLFAQQKLMTVDKLRGDTSYYTEKFYVYGKGGMAASYKPYIAIQLLKRKGDLFLQISGSYPGKYITSLPEGDSIYFKQQAGNIVSISFPTSTTTDYSTCAGCNVTFYKQTVLISPETLYTLIASPITFIRIDSEERHFDYDIEAKKQNLLLSALQQFTN